MASCPYSFIKTDQLACTKYSTVIGSCHEHKKTQSSVADIGKINTPEPLSVLRESYVPKRLAQVVTEFTYGKYIYIYIK
jgi:hypothetical protein